ncbi:MAG: class I SAM-dependent methyltransferase [Chloroflexota bacterium]|nr:class I SAM-dependent methyltransferase [Chloroflexota bacterium]
MTRWGRAARLLRLPPGSRVLDLGCAFGFGTRLLARRYETFGHDLSATYIERAHRALPGIPFTVGAADRVPYPDGFFDGVVLLDVLEHVPNERPVLAEIARLLRPGGRLIVSVPNRGWLAGFDSLNLYHDLLGAAAPAPTDDPSWPEVHLHRHYSLEELRTLLGGDFYLRSARYTGLGLAELVNLVLLLLCKALLRRPRAYEVLQYLYFGVYLLEDLMPTGAGGYHLMIEAERLTNQPTQEPSRPCGGPRHPGGNWNDRPNSSFFTAEL